MLQFDSLLLWISEYSTLNLQAFFSQCLLGPSVCYAWVGCHNCGGHWECQKWTSPSSGQTDFLNLYIYSHKSVHPSMSTTSLLWSGGYFLFSKFKVKVIVQLCVQSFRKSCLPSNQSGSYFTQRVLLIKGCAVTLNKISWSKVYVIQDLSNILIWTICFHIECFFLGL